MRLIQAFTVSAIFLFGVTSARADSGPSSDPRIIVGHPAPGSSIACGGAFTLHADASGGGVTNCRNTSGEFWTGLIITGTTTGATFGCDNSSSIANIFSHCTTSVMKGPGGIEDVTFTFTGGEIPPGSTFSIDLNNSGLFGQNSGGFGAKGKLMVTPIIATPEPETVLFLLVGLAGLCFLRGRRSTVI